MNPALARTSRRAALLAALPLALIPALAAACSAAASTPAPTPAITAAEVVERSRQATAALQSFRFSLYHDSGDTVLAGGIVLRSADGAAVAPDSVSFTAKTTVGRAFARIDAVLTATETYMTNPITGKWSLIPQDESPFGTFNPPRLVATILGRVENPSFAEPPAPGADYAVSAQISAAAFASLVGHVNPGYTLDIVLRIDPSSFHLKRVEADGRVSDAEAEDVRRIIELSDFDAPISIEPPL